MDAATEWIRTQLRAAYDTWRARSGDGDPTHEVPEALVPLDQARAALHSTPDPEAPHRLPFELSVLESGMLRPKKSQLAVFGLTRQVHRVRRLTDLVPCQSCSLARCHYRRAPYARAAGVLKV